MCLVSTLTGSDGDGFPRNDGDDDEWRLHGHPTIWREHAHVELEMEDQRLEYGLPLPPPSLEGNHENAFSIVPRK